MKVVFVGTDGSRSEVEGESGLTLREVAINNGIDGIFGDCSGCAICATCHVYVDDAYADALAPMSEDEDATLDITSAERRSNSRLSCQIQIDNAPDGLTVVIPEKQL